LGKKMDSVKGRSGDSQERVPLKEKERAKGNQVKRRLKLLSRTEKKTVS